MSNLSQQNLFAQGSAEPIEHVPHDLVSVIERTGIMAQIRAGAPRAVYLYLAHRARSRPDDHQYGICWPKQEKIALGTGYGLSQVAKAIQYLANCGLIDRKKKRKLYWYRFPAEPDLLKMAEDGPINDPVDARKLSTSHPHQCPSTGEVTGAPVPVVTSAPVPVVTSAPVPVRSRSRSKLETNKDEKEGDYIPKSTYLDPVTRGRIKHQDELKEYRERQKQKVARQTP